MTQFGKDHVAQSLIGISEEAEEIQTEVEMVAAYIKLLPGEHQAVLKLIEKINATCRNIQTTAEEAPNWFNASVSGNGTVVFAD